VIDRRKVRAVAAGVISAALSGLLMASAMAALAESPGVAVVINADLALDVELPGIEELRADPGGVVEAFRDAGLRVAVDPTGRCLAVTAPSRLSDEELLTGELARVALVAGILERTTSEQLAAREMGYLGAEVLSEVQWAAALRLAQRAGMVDEEGHPTREGERLRVGLWPTWVVHVSTRHDGRSSCHKLRLPIRPPTLCVVTQPPLSGSTLWWASPYAEASWGGERVSVKAGTYTLDDLVARLSKASEVDIITRGPASGRRFSVIAADVPVRTLLWATEVAAGLPAHIAEDAEPPIVLIASGGEPTGYYRLDTNVLLPVPGLGYWSPADTPIGRELLSSMPRGPTDKELDQICWRLADLPLLYRNWIAEEWQRKQQLPYGEPGPHHLDPDHTFVLWVKAVLVSVGTYMRTGRGGGYRFPMPAL